MVKKKASSKNYKIWLAERRKSNTVSWEKLYVGKVSRIMYFKSRAISKTCGEKVKLENVQ